MSNFAQASQSQCIDNSLFIKEPAGSKVIFEADNWYMQAVKGTDIYSSPDGATSVNQAPKATVILTGDFEVTSIVKAEFNDSYDGAGLFVYANKDNWAKLMFERFSSGENGLASTVNRNNGDDAYHLRTNEAAIKLKATRNANVISFYYSFDGEDWMYTRAFTLNKGNEVSVGLFAQSPLTGKMSAIFSDVCAKSVLYVPK